MNKGSTESDGRWMEWPWKDGIGGVGCNLLKKICVGYSSIVFLNIFFLF